MNLFNEPEDDLIEETVAAGAKPAGGAALLPPRQNPLCLGHEIVEKTILDMHAQGRMPHALIFAGPQGIGKSTQAFCLAKKLLKEEKLVSSGGHPDLLFVERQFDEKKGRRKESVDVEEVRRVAPFMRKTASLGGWRIVIVDDADTMTRSAQNALLKILEEPPPQALLILIAHRPGALIPTIRSRARVFPFMPPEKTVFHDLIRRENPQLSGSDVATLHAITAGSVGQGPALLEEGGLEAVYKVVGLLNTWPDWDWKPIHGLADNLSKPGQEGNLKAFAHVFLWAIRAVTRAKARGESPPAPLDTDVIRSMVERFSLEDWSHLGEMIQTHFDTAHFANLDRKQTVIGAFSCISTKDAA